MTDQYPEHEKLTTIHETSQTIGDFIAWLSDTKGWHLATFDTVSPACRNCEHDDPHQTTTNESGGYWVCGVDECGCESHNRGSPDRMYRPHYSVEDLLAEFFDINPKELEREKRQMLASIRRN